MPPKARVRGPRDSPEASRVHRRQESSSQIGFYSPASTAFKGIPVSPHLLAANESMMLNMSRDSPEPSPRSSEATSASGGGGRQRAATHHHHHNTASSSSGASAASSSHHHQRPAHLRTQSRALDELFTSKLEPGVLKRRQNSLLRDYSPMLSPDGLYIDDEAEQMLRMNLNSSGHEKMNPLLLDEQDEDLLQQDALGGGGRRGSLQGVSSFRNPAARFSDDEDEDTHGRANSDDDDADGGDGNKSDNSIPRLIDDDDDDANNNREDSTLRPPQPKPRRGSTTAIPTSAPASADKQKKRLSLLHINTTIAKRSPRGSMFRTMPAPGNSSSKHSPNRSPRRANMLSVMGRKSPRGSIVRSPGGSISGTNPNTSNNNMLLDDSERIIMRGTLSQKAFTPNGVVIRGRAGTRAYFVWHARGLTIYESERAWQQNKRPIRLIMNEAMLTSPSSQPVPASKTASTESSILNANATTANSSASTSTIDASATGPAPAAAPTHHHHHHDSLEAPELMMIPYAETSSDAAAAAAQYATQTTHQLPHDSARMVRYAEKDASLLRLILTSPSAYAAASSAQHHTTLLILKAPSTQAAKDWLSASSRIHFTLARERAITIASRSTANQGVDTHSMKEDPNGFLMTKEMMQGDSASASATGSVVVSPTSASAANANSPPADTTVPASGSSAATIAGPSAMVSGRGHRLSLLGGQGQSLLAAINGSLSPTAGPAAPPASPAAAAASDEKPKLTAGRPGGLSLTIESGHTRTDSPMIINVHSVYQPQPSPSSARRDYQDSDDATLFPPPRFHLPQDSTTPSPISQSPTGSPRTSPFQFRNDFDGDIGLGQGIADDRTPNEPSFYPSQASSAASSSASAALMSGGKFSILGAFAFPAGSSAASIAYHERASSQPMIMSSMWSGANTTGGSTIVQSSGSADSGTSTILHAMTGASLHHHSLSTIPPRHVSSSSSSHTHTHLHHHAHMRTGSLYAGFRPRNARTPSSISFSDVSPYSATNDGVANSTCEYYGLNGETPLFPKLPLKGLMDGLPTNVTSPSSSSKSVLLSLSQLGPRKCTVYELLQWIVFQFPNSKFELPEYSNSFDPPAASTLGSGPTSPRSASSIGSTGSTFGSSPALWSQIHILFAFLLYRGAYLESSQLLEWIQEMWEACNVQQNAAAAAATTGVSATAAAASQGGLLPPPLFPEDVEEESSITRIHNTALDPPLSSSRNRSANDDGSGSSGPESKSATPPLIQSLPHLTPYESHYVRANILFILLTWITYFRRDYLEVKSDMDTFLKEKIYTYVSQWDTDRQANAMTGGRRDAAASTTVSSAGLASASPLSPASTSGDPSDQAHRHLNLCALAAQISSTIALSAGSSESVLASFMPVPDCLLTPAAVYDPNIADEDTSLASFGHGLRPPPSPSSHITNAEMSWAHQKSSLGLGVGIGSNSDRQTPSPMPAPAATHPSGVPLPVLAGGGSGAGSRATSPPVTAGGIRNALMVPNKMSHSRAASTGGLAFSSPMHARNSSTSGVMLTGTLVRGLSGSGSNSNAGSIGGASSGIGSGLMFGPGGIPSVLSPSSTHGGSSTSLHHAPHHTPRASLGGVIISPINSPDPHNDSKNSNDHGTPSISTTSSMATATGTTGVLHSLAHRPPQAFQHKSSQLLFLKKFVSFTANTNLTTYSPKDLASELTNIDLEHLPCIHTRELTHRVWTTRNNTQRQVQAGQVAAYITSFNRRSFWVATEILRAGTASTDGSSLPTPLSPKEQDQHRLDMLIYFIQVLYELYNLSNYYTCFAILNGLSLQPLFRLTRLWNSLPISSLAIYESLRSLLSSSHNFMQYRELVRTAALEGRAHISHFAVVLKDLYAYEELPTFFVNRNALTTNVSSTLSTHTSNASVASTNDAPTTITVDTATHPPIRIDSPPSVASSNSDHDVFVTPLPTISPAPDDSPASALPRTANSSSAPPTTATGTDTATAASTAATTSSAATSTSNQAPQLLNWSHKYGRQFVELYNSFLLSQNTLYLYERTQVMSGVNDATTSSSAAAPIDSAGIPSYSRNRSASAMPLARGSVASNNATISAVTNALPATSVRPPLAASDPTLRMTLHTSLQRVWNEERLYQLSAKIQPLTTIVTAASSSSSAAASSSTTAPPTTTTQPK